MAASTAAFRTLFQGKKWQNLNSKISNRELLSKKSRPETGRTLEEGRGDGERGRYGGIEMVTTNTVKDGERRSFEDVAL